MNEFHDPMLRLQTAVADARAVADLLETQQRFEVRRLFDGDASLRAVRTLFEHELPAQVGANDRVVVYLACHGNLILTDRGPVGHLLFQDAMRGEPDTYLPMADLHDAVAKLPCRHLLLVLDCCFAGAFQWSAQRDIAADTLYAEQFERCLANPAWQVLTSTASDETALDLDPRNRENVEGHSPFARALLAGIGDGKAELLKNGLILASELYLYLRSELAKIPGHEQTAGLFAFARHGKGEFVFERPDYAVSLPVAPRLTEASNPYRGLKAYDVADRELFFGRARVVESLAARVRSESLVVVLGASGVGKSSLVRAGLVPLLRDADEDVVAPARLGEKPDEVLRNLLASTAPVERRVLILDQLEDVFTACSEPARRESFFALVAGCLRDPTHRFAIVATLRSDYEPSFIRGPLAALWKVARFVVPPMTQNELREAIEKPALARVLYFEPPGLVDMLINEVVLMPGALPLLSFALSELFHMYLARGAEDRALSEDDFIALGGVTSSITRRATAELEALVHEDAAYANTMRNVMLRFVSVDGGEAVRRRVAERELVYADPAEHRRVSRVVQRLSDARLLVAGATEDLEPSTFLEPAHNALITGWDKMREWLTQRRAIVLVLSELRDEVRRWEEERRTPHRLWVSEPRLPQLVALQHDERGVLNAAEEAFVEQSARRRRRRRRNTIATVATIFTVLSSLVVVATVFARQARSNAARAEEQSSIKDLERRRSLAEGATLLAERPGSFMPALVKAMAAWTGSGDAHADPLVADALRELAARAVPSYPLEPHRGGSASLVAMAPNGKWFVTSAEDGTRVWDCSDPTAPPRVIARAAPNGTGDSLRRGVFSPDSHSLATVSTAFQLATVSTAFQLWSIPDLTVPPFSIGYDSNATSDPAVMFSAGGERLYTLDDTRRLRVWDVAARRQLSRPERDPPAMPMHPSTVALALSPTQPLLVATDGVGDLRLHDPGTGRLLWHTGGHKFEIRAVAFTSDGRQLLSASEDGAIRAWRVTSTPELRATAKQLNIGPAEDVRFVNDTLVLTRSNGRVQLWEWPALSLRQEIVGGAELSANRSRLLAEADDVARIYELDVAKQVMVLRFMLDGHGRARSSSFFVDGDRILTTGSDGVFRVWDLRRSGALVVQRAPAPTTGMAWSSDGRLATCTATTLSIWTRRARTFEATQVIEDHDRSWNPCHGVAWASRDARLILDRERGVQVIDARAGGVVAQTPRYEPFRGLSSDGRRFWTVSGGSVTAVKTWDASTGSLVSEAPFHLAWSRSPTALAGDSNLYFVGEGEGEGHIFDLSAPGQTIPLAHTGAPIRHAAFDAQGAHLATWDDDGTLSLWSARDGRLVSRSPRPYDWSGGRALGFAGDKHLLVPKDAGTVVLEVPSLVATCQLPGSVVDDGARRVVVRGDDGISVFELATCQRVAHVALGDQQRATRSSNAWSVEMKDASLSSDARWLAMTDASGFMHIIDLDASASFAFGCEIVREYDEVPNADPEELGAVRVGCNHLR